MQANSYVLVYPNFVISFKNFTQANFLRDFVSGCALIIFKFLTRNGSTPSKWVSLVSCDTRTNRRMFRNVTQRIKTTTAWTWVFTSLIYACKICGTFFINYAFGTTIWWSANVIGKTRARSCISNNATLGVWTAR